MPDLLLSDTVSVLYYVYKPLKLCHFVILFSVMATTFVMKC